MGLSDAATRGTRDIELLGLAVIVTDRMLRLCPWWRRPSSRRDRIVDAIYDEIASLPYDWTYNARKCAQ